MAAPGTSRDAIALLADDHRELRKLFAAFARTDRRDLEACCGIVELACTELGFHTVLEEELFYPAVRAHVPGGERLIESAEADHAAAKGLIARLATLTPADPSYAATFAVLAEQIEKHIGTEEREIFPRLENDALDLDQVAAAMRRRKEVLRGAVDTPAQAEPSLAAEGCGEPTADEALRAAERG